MSDSPTPDSRYAALLDRVAAERRSLYQTLGTLSDADDATAFRPNPGWPGGRQAWREVRRDGRIMLVSDGLSDPVPGEEPDDNTGFGLEFYIETDEPLDTSARTWLYSAIYEVSQTAADHGEVRYLLEDLELLSVEIESRNFPEHLRTDEGTFGLLLNVPSDLPSHLELSTGLVMFVAITVLTPSELDHAFEHGDDGRVELAERLAAAGVGHLSRTERDAVV